MKGGKTMDKKSSEVYTKPPEKEKTKPSIPREVLIPWVEDKIKSLRNVSLIRGGFLWEHGDIERYRINVWMRETVEGQFCEKIYISHSWFVHYHRRTKLIVDKTKVAEKDEKKYYY